MLRLMCLSTIIWMSLALLPSVSIAADTSPHAAAVAPCPAATAREPLYWLGKRGNDPPTLVPEGRRILLDSDSYPRKPARLVADPRMESDTRGHNRITFTLDAADDIEVCVLGPDGRVIRRLGCGVLGSNAPEPFEKDKLSQAIEWDGLDDQGKPAPRGWQVEVRVGLRPTFERFVGYRKDQLLNYLSGLSVDQAGRVYVALHTSLRYDPVVLRFDRAGRYLDMVYPSDPAELSRTNRRLQNVYDPVEEFDGRVIPLKESVWRYWIQRWEDYMKFPFRIGPDGKGYLIIGTPAKIESLHAVPGTDARIFTIGDLDHFWFQPSAGPWHYAPVFIWRWDAAFAFDRHGHVYVATNSFFGTHGDYIIGDSNAYGTIRKVNIETGKNVAAFSFNGKQRLPNKSVYLGTPGTIIKNDELNEFAEWTKPGAAEPKRDPRDSDCGFIDVADTTVDAQDNLFVVDGHPRRIKIYAGDGRWLGEIGELTVDEQPRRFLDIANIFWANDSLYVLTTFRDDLTGKMYLVKCRGAADRQEVVWSIALDKLARFIAVDEKAMVPIVWVGNGGGEATLTRIVDNGDRPGMVRNLGGFAPRTLVYPCALAASADGKLFVHDYARRQIIRTDDRCEDWKVVATPPNPRYDALCQQRRFVYEDSHHREHELNPRSLCVDNVKRRLLVTTRAGAKGGVPSPGFQVFDFDLCPCTDFRLQPQQDSAERRIASSGLAHQWPWASEDWPASLGGFDRRGNLYATTTRWLRTDKVPEDLPSCVVKYGPDGTLCSPRHVQFYLSSGNLAADSRGNTYVYDVGRFAPAKAGYDFPDMTWGYWRKPNPYPRGPYLLRRGDRPVRHISELTHLVKFGPGGGVRFTDDELWAHRGGSVHAACGGCDFPANMLACDEADRIIAGDVAHYCVNLYDSAGNLINRFGTYGNAQTVPGDGDAKRLGFRNIYSLATAGDAVYVSDKDLRRVAKVRLDYRESKRVAGPP